MSYTCLADFVHTRELHRTRELDFQTFAQSVKSHSECGAFFICIHIHLAVKVQLLDSFIFPHTQEGGSCAWILTGMGFIDKQILIENAFS